MAFALGLMAAGTALDAYGKYRAGDSAKKARKFEAAQMDRLANRAVASSQRDAQEVERQGQLQMSRALAVSAASGGGASDPTVMDIIGDLAGDTDYRKMVALYEGKTRADELRLGAETRRMAGDVAKDAGKFSAFGTALSGATSMYANYGESTIKPWVKNTYHSMASKAFPGGPRKL